MIDFNNTEVAFQMKSGSDLQQSRLLFSSLRSPSMVKVLQQLTLAAFKLRLPITGIIKKTVFRQFCGGESVEDCAGQINRLLEYKVNAILDYSAEGTATEEDWDKAVEITMKTIDYAVNNPGVPFGVFKPTGLGSEEIYTKASEGTPLTPQEMAEWMTVQGRWQTILEYADHHGVPVLVDAEDSWYQPAVDELVLRFMRQYNKEKAMVYNTSQLYRHDRLAHLERMLALAKEEGFIYAVKTVRGAYMEKERERAEEKGYEAPIQPTKEATDRDFDLATTLIINNLDHMSGVIGTHNENSVAHTAALLKEKGLPVNHDKIWIAQLFGMSDHISFNAAAYGLNVAKYLPFGPVKTVMPYLFRRAEENTSVAGQTGRELSLIHKELARRSGK